METYAIGPLVLAIAGPRVDSHEWFWKRFSHFTSALPTNWTVELSVDPTVVQETRHPEYPAFRVQRCSEHLLKVARFDGNGSIDTKNQIAHFTVGPNVHSLEAAIRVFVSMTAPLHGAFLLHASAVAIDSRARIFAGVSGAGKSTISENLATHSLITKLSDEIVFLVRDENGWSVAPTPFIGTSWPDEVRALPLATIHFVQQAANDYLTNCSSFSATCELSRHLLLYSQSPKTAEATVELLANLVAEVPISTVHCRNHSQVSTLFFAKEHAA